MVAVFQWGWLAGLFELDRTYLIAPPLAAIFFAVLFGLSMDYEVFLVSRIREAHEVTGDNAEAVARGLAAQLFRERHGGVPRSRTPLSTLLWDYCQRREWCHAR